MSERYIKRSSGGFNRPEGVVPLKVIIHDTPLRVLPHKPLIDDFYSTIIDWNKHLYFNIDKTLFIHDFGMNKSKKLFGYRDVMLNSVKALDDTVCVGSMEGNLCLFNVEKQKLIKYKPHKARIGVLDTYHNLLFSGSRDRSVKCWDLRVKKEVYSVINHTQEVCGLKLSPCGKYVASGGNDNKLVIHDRRMDGVPMRRMIEHTAAVKAIAWNPYDTQTLVSGGGTACKALILWNLNSPIPQKRVDTGSQVCNLFWTRKNEIISTHGYSQNEIRVLSPYTLQTKEIYNGHKSRVLHFAMSKEEDMFVAGSSESGLICYNYDKEDDHVRIR